MLAAVQRGLERLYRVETALDVEDFVIDEETRQAFSPARAPREQLLVHEADGGLELALYLCPQAIANLSGKDAVAALTRHRGDFFLAVEGVSHFVYVAWRAQQARPVSPLELELQAEVDKFVTCALATGADLRAAIFEDFHLDPACDAGERERYMVANENARAYADFLHERFLRRGEIPGMLAELRRFYRLGMQEKLELIRSAG